MTIPRSSRPPPWRLVCLTLALGGAASAQSAQPQTGTPFTLEDALNRLDAAPSVTAARLSVQTAQTGLNAARTP